MMPGFLNVDLEITARSKSRLDSLAAEIGKRVMVLYSGPTTGKQYLLTMEILGLSKGPDATIHALCSLVEKLSPAARRTWDSAKKAFDVGYELQHSERSSRFALRPDTLQRVAKLGADLAVTYYRGSEPGH